MSSHFLLESFQHSFRSNQLSEMAFRKVSSAHTAKPNAFRTDQGLADLSTELRTVNSFLLPQTL